MMETVDNLDNPSNSLLLEQHYLFERSGDVGVGYFPYRGQVIVVVFDASRPECFEDIAYYSKTTLMSVDYARRDWNARIEDELFPFVKPETLSARQCRIRTVLFGLAIRFRDDKEWLSKANKYNTTDANPAETGELVKRLVKELQSVNKNKPTKSSIYSHPYTERIDNE